MYSKMEPISSQKIQEETESAGCIRGYCGSPENSEGKDQGMVNVAAEMEAQRRRFRSFRFHQAKGPRDAYLQLQEHCHAWLKPESHTKEEILDLLILEHFIAILSGEMQSWVRECEPLSCAQAVASAEDFVLMLEQQGLVTFEEVTVCFTQEEWDLLNPSQKVLHRDVMQENHVNIASLVAHMGYFEEKTDQQECCAPVEPNQTSQRRLRKCISLQYGENKATKNQRCPRKQQKAQLRGVPKRQRNFIGTRMSKTISSMENSTLGEEEPQAACDEGSKEKLCLPKSKRIYNQETPFQCTDCGKRLSRKDHLTRHQQLHKEEKPYKCSYCGKAFSQSSQLITHGRTHTGEKPYECPQCRKHFRTCIGLVHHKRIHVGEIVYTCSYCGKSFHQNSRLLIHERNHIEGRPYNCSICGKSFSSNSEIVRHGRTHTGEKPYKCSFCGKTFTQSTHRIAHERSHTGDNPYKCPVCGKRFSCNSHLVVHQRIHTGEKPFKCSACGKSFGSRSHLIVHERIHTGEKPYKCSTCGKGFTCKSYLILHERTHTGEKPHKCSVCGKSFGRNADLVVHKRTHTGEKAYHCSTCGKGFNRHKHLAAHEKTHMEVFTLIIK